MPPPAETAERKPPPAGGSPPRRKSAEQRLRILDRLTAGLGLAHIARVEGLSVRRVRQIIDRTLENREIDPPAGFVQLQLARLGEAMVVAHTLMLDGNLQAMDRFIKLTAELDRYHGFGRGEIAASADPPRRLPAPASEPLALAQVEGDREIFPLASP